MLTAWRLQIQLAKVTDGGDVVVSPAFSLDTKWDWDEFVKTKAGTAGSW
jgi:hypothetical protein